MDVGAAEPDGVNANAVNPLMTGAPPARRAGDGAGARWEMEGRLTSEKPAPAGDIILLAMKNAIFHTEKKMFSIKCSRLSFKEV